MKRWRVCTLLLLLCCMSVSIAGVSFADPPKPQFKMDKELCELMIRFGKESFSRDRFSDAKYYFQLAVQADPGSEKAWNYYDLASMYTLAEQMKTEGKYIFRPASPSVSLEVPPAQKTTPDDSPPPDYDTPPPPEAEKEEAPGHPAESEGFEIADDEGC